MNSLLFPILSIISAVGLYFFFISPNLEEINILKEKDAEFTKSLEDVREIENIMAELESSYASISKDDLLKLNHFIPTDVDNTQVANDMSAMLIEEGAVISSIDVSNRPTPPKNQDSETLLFEHSVSLSFFSDYNTFKNVLKNIENNLQIARISVVDINTSVDSDLGLTGYEIGLVFYSYSAKK